MNGQLAILGTIPFSKGFHVYAYERWGLRQKWEKFEWATPGKIEEKSTKELKYMLKINRLKTNQ